MSTRNKAETVFECLKRLLDGNIIRRDDGSSEEKVEIKTLLGPKKILGIFVAADWCPSCKDFTPKLVSFFQTFKPKDRSFEIVFISSDNDVTIFDKFYKQMPWLALSYGARNQKEVLCKKLKIKRIPTLVMIDGETGDIISRDASSKVISDQGGEEFPWADKPFTEMISGKVSNHQGEEKDIGSMMKGNYTGFYFLPKEEDLEYTDIQENLSKITRGDLSEIKSFAKPPKIAELVMEALCLLFNQTPSFKSAMLLLSVFTFDDLKHFNKEAIPVQILDKLEPYINNPDFDVDKAKNMGILLGAVCMWIKAVYHYARSRYTSDQKMKSVMSALPALQSASSIKEFNQKLAQSYDKLKTDGKNFEVLLVNQDTDEKCFKNKLGKFPLFAIPYGDERRAYLVEKYDIHGEERLVIVDEEGKVINEDGVAAVLSDSLGEEFPWKKKPVNKLTAELFRHINENTCLVLLTGDTEDDESSALRVLADVASAEIAKGDNQDLHCFYTGSSMVWRKLTKYAGFKFDSEQMLIILDVPNDKKYICPDTVITRGKVTKFVSQYYSGELKASSIKQVDVIVKKKSKWFEQK